MKISKDRINNFIVMINVIITLAFNDFSNLCVIIQLISMLFLVILNYNEVINSGSSLLIFFKIFFAFSCFLSYIWAINKENIFYWTFGSLFSITNTVIMMFYIRNENSFKKFLHFLSLAGIVLCIRMLLTVPISAWGRERVGVYLAHDGAGYGYTGITYVLGMISTIIMCSTSVYKKKITKWILCAIFIIFSLMSGSKKQIFILIITIFMLAFLKSDNQKKMIKNIFVIIISLVIISILVLKIDFFYNVIGVRLESFFKFFSDEQINSDASTISRARYLSVALDIFIQHPFTGIGIDCFKFANPYTIAWAENNYVELLADLGIFGTFIYYVPHFVILSGLLKRIKKKYEFDIILFISIICLLFIDFSMVSYHTSTLQFFLSFVFVSNCFMKNYYKKQNTM